MKFNYTHTQYASYIGCINQAIVNIFPPLIFIVFQKDFNISFTQIGLLSSFNFAIQMLIDFLAIKFIDKIGYRIPIVLAHVFSALGLIMLGILPFFINPYIAILICFFINAISGGLIEVFYTFAVTMILE